ncbi:MAG: hypothetical protein NT070_04710 [Cyanobacteria bacterium]|nr:hypothetical protein [Cyanobacteriota bacterium]
MIIVDTGFWLALADQRDSYHQRAMELRLGMSRSGLWSMSWYDRSHHPSIAVCQVSKKLRRSYHEVWRVNYEKRSSIND